MGVTLFAILFGTKLIILQLEKTTVKFLFFLGLTIKLSSGAFQGEISQSCLDCICYASTGCDVNKKCHNAGGESYFCGPYQIGWAYWADGGKHGNQGTAHDFE